MIHGRDRDAVCVQVDHLVARFGLDQVDRKILFSGRCFKQRGAAYRQRRPADNAGQNIDG